MTEPETALVTEHPKARARSLEGESEDASVASLRLGHFQTQRFPKRPDDSRPAEKRGERREGRRSGRPPCLFEPSPRSKTRRAERSSHARLAFGKRAQVQHVLQQTLRVGVRREVIPQSHRAENREERRPVPPALEVQVVAVVLQRTRLAARRTTRAP